MDMSTQGAQEFDTIQPDHRIQRRRREEGEHNGNGYNSSAQRLARGLGWFSIGLGFAELFAPKAVARIAGLKSEDTGLIQLYGLREIASGVAIFMQGDRPAEAVWSRVAGDAMDLASLGVAFTSPESNKARLSFATANVVAVTALDVICAKELSSDEFRSANGDGRSESVSRRSLIIDRSPEELYQAWHDFERLPQFMRRLESVRVTGGNRSHWVAIGPAGKKVEWDAEIVEDRPNEHIAWRSLEGADVYNSGFVNFRKAPGDRGAIVTVGIDYDPPGGVISRALAPLVREDPGQLAQEALRRFKQIMEVGEVAISDGAAWDNGMLTQRPAQPLADDEANQARNLNQSNRGRAAAARA